MTAKKVPGRKVRYGVVAGGWISQGYFMPGVEHTGNSELVALVSGDPKKAEQLKKKYGLKATYDYGQFEAMLHSGEVDAIYLATPNWMHTEYAVPALKAGIHVLLEKPMAITGAECQQMISASEESGGKLMVAYRLHFEPGTIAAIELVRSGKLGEVQVFTSTFSQRLSLDNHRAKHGFEAGPVYDMGPYPLNEVRNLFGAEPIEVHAVGVQHRDLGFVDMDDVVSVTLRFPENRLAQFIVSYSHNDIDEYSVLGTKGSLTSQPAYLFGKPIKHKIVIGTDSKEKEYKETDHFGGEMKYFSDCILHDKHPEPDGEEGFCDVRVLEAIRRALETGQTQRLAPYQRKNRIESSQEMTLSPVKVPKLVDSESPDRNG